MFGPTTITSKGQVTIPEGLRLLANAQPGNKAIFNFIPSKKQIVIDIISTKNVVEELAGSLKSHVKYTNKRDVEKKVGKFLARELGLTK